MGLNVCLEIVKPVAVFEANITHNLNVMAQRAGLYKALWRPEDLGVKKARDLVGPLYLGLDYMQRNKEELEALNPKNGWGTTTPCLTLLNNTYTHV